jgi:hypothetical protein
MVGNSKPYEKRVIPSEMAAPSDNRNANKKAVVGRFAFVIGSNELGSAQADRSRRSK